MSRRLLVVAGALGTVGALAAVALAAPARAPAPAPAPRPPLATHALASAPAPARTRAPAPRFVQLQLLGVNDLHGNLEPVVEAGEQPAGGVAYLAAHLDRARARNPRGTILVHAGDMVGGSPLISSWFHDEPTILATDVMGVDVGTLGNHELDEGEAEAMRLIRGGHRADGRQFRDGADTSATAFRGAGYPYVSANVVRRGTDRPVLAPYLVLRRRGVRVGVIGVTTLQTPAIVAPDAIAGLRFLDLSDSVNRAVAALRRRGIHAIVVLAHAGGHEVLDETRQMDRDVDVVVAGHTHQRMLERVGGRLVVQARSYGRAFDRVRLTVDRRTGQVVAKRAWIVDAPDARVTPAPKLAELVASYHARVASVADRVIATAAAPVGRQPTPTGESALGELVADAQRETADADVALVAPGALRADLPAGPVTYAHVFAAQPWDDAVVRMTLSGAQLRRVLEQQFERLLGTRILQVSGLGWRRRGTEVADVTVAGAPLDDARDYRVAVSAPLATGAAGFTALAEGRDVKRVGTDVEALVALLRAQPQPYEAPDLVAAPRILVSG